MDVDSDREQRVGNEAYVPIQNRVYPEDDGWNLNFSPVWLHNLLIGYCLVTLWAILVKAQFPSMDFPEDRQ